MSTDARRSRGLLDRIVNPVVDAVDADALIARIDINDLLERVDIDEILTRIDIDALLTRIDIDALLTRIDIDALLTRIDLNHLVGRIDLDTLLQRIDINAIVGQVDVNALIRDVDLNGLIAEIDLDGLIGGLDINALVGRVELNDLVMQIDLDALVARIDIAALVNRIDLNALVGSIDINALVGRVDLEGLIARIDLDALVQRIDVNTIVSKVDIQGIVNQVRVADMARDSATQMATGVLDLVRRNVARADGLAERGVDAALRRPRDDFRSAPRLAGPFARLGSYLLDTTFIGASFSITIAAVSYLAGLFTERELRPSSGPEWAWIGAGVAWAGAYFFFSFLLAQRTPGMRIMGIWVASGSGDLLRPRQALVRTLVFPLSFVLGLGFIGIVVGRRHRALHDVAANTLVVTDVEIPAPRTTAPRTYGGPTAVPTDAAA